jgi:hypothetical protein
MELIYNSYTATYFHLPLCDKEFINIEKLFLFGLYIILQLH